MIRLLKTLKVIEVLLVLYGLYIAYFEWFKNPENNQSEPKYVILTTLIALIGYIILFLSKKIKNKENCPYEAINFHQTQDLILQSTINKLQDISFKENNLDLTQKILYEKHDNNIKYLPAILLSSNIIKISKTLSEEKDTNKINNNFISTLKDICKYNIWNNPTYRLMDIDTDKSKLILGSSDYFKTLSTCDIHYYNFINKNSHMIDEKGKEYDLWFNALKEIIINNKFRTVSASLGCSTLLMIRNYQTKKYEYYIVDNSKIKNGRSTKHVVPAFMFQPTKQIKNQNDFRKQSDIQTQVLKEFGEELLGLEELEKINDYSLLNQKMDENKLLRYLKKLLKTKHAKLHILGISLDIYRLRPEILTILIIDDEKFYNDFTQQRKVSWEVNTNDLNGLGIYDLDDEQAYLDLIFNSSNPLVSPAAACLKLGREYMLKNTTIRK